MTNVELIALIETAQASWDGCDWAHDAQDQHGNHIEDDHGNRVVCDGDNADECAYCRRATADAQAAVKLGNWAIKEIRRNDIDQAKKTVEDARSLELEWGDCPAWRPVSEALESIKTYDGEYADSNVPGAVTAAIKHANWFREEDDRLRTLAMDGKSDEIRSWAEEIRNDLTGDDEDDAYWDVTADMWDAVADAVDELLAEVER